MLGYESLEGQKQKVGHVMRDPASESFLADVASSQSYLISRGKLEEPDASPMLAQFCDIVHRSPS